MTASGTTMAGSRPRVGRSSDSTGAGSGESRISMSRDPFRPVSSFSFNAYMPDIDGVKKICITLPSAESTSGTSAPMESASSCDPNAETAFCEPSPARPEAFTIADRSP